MEEQEQYLVTDIELTVRRYFGELKDSISVQMLDNDWNAVFLPQTDSRGELFVVYIREMGGETFMITDNGRAMDAVGESGSLFPDQDIESMLTAVAAANWVEYDSRQLWVDADRTDLGEAVGRMLRVMMFADGLCAI